MITKSIGGLKKYMGQFRIIGNEVWIAYQSGKLVFFGSLALAKAKGVLV